ELPPSVNAPVVQASVFHGNGQTKPRPTGRPGTSRVGTPEPVKDPFNLFLAHPHTVVSHDDRYHGVVTFDDHIDRVGFPVFNRVIDEVAQDTFNSSRINFSGKRIAFGHHG